MEHWFFNRFSERTEHASLITGLYRCYSDHITLLKRPKGSQVELSVLREKKGRLSGTIVTYVGNTITNTNKTITHLALALCPELVKENRLDDAADAIWKKVEDKELNCYISGDDKVVLVTQQNIISISKEIRYWENTGYVRKDIDPQQPSHIITKFKDIEFCSHRPIEVKFEVGERDSDGNLKSSKLVSRWCAVKPQSEIFAKAVYSVGQFLDVEAEAGHALQIRNYLIQYSFFEGCEEDDTSYQCSRS